MIKKRKFGLYVFLEIITLGIYGIFFWYKWTEDVNKICDGDEKDSANYLLVVLLDIFSFSIYSFVWNYQMVERLCQLAPKYGKELKHGGMFAVIFRMFLPIVLSYTKVKYLNKLAEAYNASVSADGAEAEAAAEASNDVFESAE